MVKVVLKNPDLYTDEERRLIKDYVCPECHGDLLVQGDKLFCENEENCGFFCSIKKGGK